MSATSVDEHDTATRSADDVRSDRRAATVMRTIAVIGLVTSVVMAVVGWRFLSDLERNLDRSLVIGEDAATTLTETIDVASEVIAALDDGLATIDATLDGLSSTTSDTADVAAATAELAASLPETLDDVDAALASVESLGGTIDGALRAVSRIPLGPDYDPPVPFPEAVADLRAAFDPLGADLESIAGELRSFADGTGEVGVDLERVRADVARTQAALSDSDELLDRYRSAAQDAEVLARTSRDDADTSLELARWAIVLLATLVAVSQYVPWWLARRIDQGNEGLEFVSRPSHLGTDAAGVPDEGT